MVGFDSTSSAFLLWPPYDNTLALQSVSPVEFHYELLSEGNGASKPTGKISEDDFYCINGSGKLAGIEA